MARIYARRRGKSGSIKVARDGKPGWVEMGPKEVEELIENLADAGHSGSEIGTILKDRYGIPSVKSITGEKMSKILKQELPEDLAHLISRAKSLEGHLANHPKDECNIRQLQLVESKIRRLTKYYKRGGVLPEGWKYRPE
jgi:small subunit ribosomal protein S15